MGSKRKLRDLDERVLGRDWPTWSRLPALTTLEALGVIILALVVAAFLPRISLGHGFELDPGQEVVGLGLAFAALSPKRMSRTRRRKTSGLANNGPAKRAGAPEGGGTETNVA